MRRILLLLSVAAALFVGHAALPASSSADPYYCDGVNPDSILSAVGVEDAAACGGAAGLAWRVAGPYGVWWAGWCNNLGASAWVGSEYWHCTWFYG